MNANSDGVERIVAPHKGLRHVNKIKYAYRDRRCHACGVRMGAARNSDVPPQPHYSSLPRRDTLDAMELSRTFLGLETPALVAAAESLFDRFSQDPAADLRDVIAVVPGARAGRRLLEILVDRADARRLTLTPPQIVTVGQLPELLYQAKKPFADELVQRLTWAAALREFDHTRLGLVVAERPAEADAERWLDLGRLLRSLHRELASDGLDFNDVVERGRSLPGFTEAGRWQALAEIQRAYLDQLDDLGLWDRQTARLFAIEQHECRSDHPIVLIAAVDLNQSLRQMLDQVADQVTALIFAPDGWADRFDSHGCLLAEAWQDVELKISEETLLQADDPADQSELVARRIAQLNGRFRADEITVGLPDERIVPQLVRQLDECDLPNRYGPGKSVTRTGVYRMLENLAALVHGNQYADLAQVVRHPDIESWLLRGGVKPGWIEELDDYYNVHLPRRIDGVWLGPENRCASLSAAHERIAQLVERLQGAPRSLDHWLPQIDRILLEVYGDRNFDLDVEADRQAWKTCSCVRDALGHLSNVPRAIMPDVSGAETLNMVLEQISDQGVAPASDEAAIELVGWLELPLDDAPLLIVTSFNEGFVPSSINADMFLPGGLRSALGLDDNARRYARDAYAVSTLLAPWRNTSFIVARRNPDDDPLAPSRLVFAAPPDEVARRALRLFGDSPQRLPQQPLAGVWFRSSGESKFEVPLPRPLPEPIARMSVTSFKTYLDCPYRFYLSRVLRLGGADDDATELDGAGFGNLAHVVLERFGRSERRDVADAEAIQRELNHLLDRLARDRFGERPGAALLVQIEQLRLRLHAFARWQADRAAQGWRIEHTELADKDRPGRLDVDGKPMLLVGRIDRIDFHEQSGERQILDYKTSDAGDSPEKTHRRRSSAWVDLQLPLYRHLAREFDIDGPVGLGYVLLPKNTTAVGLSLAAWSAEELETADETAREIVRKVRAKKFWPPTEPPPKYSEEFAAICMDGVFGK